MEKSLPSSLSMNFQAKFWLSLPCLGLVLQGPESQGVFFFVQASVNLSYFCAFCLFRWNIAEKTIMWSCKYNIDYFAHFFCILSISKLHIEISLYTETRWVILFFILTWWEKKKYCTLIVFVLKMFIWNWFYKK